MCIFDKIREHFRPINIGPFRAIPRQSDGMVLLRGVVTIFQHISGNIYIFRHLIPVYVHDRPSFYRWFHVRNREVKFLAGYSIQPNEQSFILWCAGNVATFTIAECQLSLPPSEDFVTTERRLVEGFFGGRSGFGSITSCTGVGTRSSTIYARERSAWQSVVLAWRVAHSSHLNGAS